MPKHFSLEAGGEGKKLASQLGEMHLTVDGANAPKLRRSSQNGSKWVVRLADHSSGLSRNDALRPGSGAECGPGTPKALNDVASAPFWLRILTRELFESIEDSAEAEAFASKIARLAEKSGDPGALERRFTLARLIGPVCGVAAPVAEMMGKTSPYAAGLQRLIHALGARLRAGPSAAAAELEVFDAYRSLAAAAPEPDAALLQTGAPMSFYAVWAAGAWREKRRRALGASNTPEAWSDSHAAARDDLIAALSVH